MAKSKLMGPSEANKATPVDKMCMSVGNISRPKASADSKTSGIKIRGTGAATKGTMARGPMA
jgi:hypothetical protein